MPHALSPLRRLHGTATGVPVCRRSYTARSDSLRSPQACKKHVLCVRHESVARCSQEKTEAVTHTSRAHKATSSSTTCIDLHTRPISCSIEVYGMRIVGAGAYYKHRDHSAADRDTPVIRGIELDQKGWKWVDCTRELNLNLPFVWTKTRRTNDKTNRRGVE